MPLTAAFTKLLAEVSHWIGLANCFTHLRTGLPAQDQPVILTAVLADVTNLGLTRMAEACNVASCRQLAWTAGWHLSEEGYGRALARVVAALLFAGTRDCRHQAILACSIPWTEAILGGS